MELMKRGVRPSSMMSPRQVRGTVLAVLLCSALAGCGSVTASSCGRVGSTSSPSVASSTAAASSSAPATTAAARDRLRQRQPGDVGHRAPHHAPGRPDPGGRARHDPAPRRPGARAVRPVLRYHRPRRDQGGRALPCRLRRLLLGTFYDGSRPLARFVYGASGCQTVSLTADGKTKFTRCRSLRRRAEAAGRHGRGPRGARVDAGPAAIAAGQGRPEQVTNLIKREGPVRQGGDETRTARHPCFYSVGDRDPRPGRPLVRDLPRRPPRPRTRCRRPVRVPAWTSD